MGPFSLTDQVKNVLYAGWNDQNAINGDWAAHGAEKYENYIQSGGQPLSSDPGAVQLQQTGQQKAAQAKYQQATDTAVQGLQTGKANLGQQYSDLLKTVKGVYDPLINQTTATLGAEESNRGITPDSTLFKQQVQGGLAPIYGQEAANSQQIQQGSISDVNAYNTAISSAQLGVAGNAAQLPLQYGSLNIASSLVPSQQSYYSGQGQYYNGLNANQLAIERLKAQVPFGVQSGVVFKPGPGQFQTATGGGGNINPALVIASRTKPRPQIQTISNYVQ